MIEIDGSYGEGGGAIIRTAVALSAVTGKPFRIENIRANRAKPGLQAQHSTAVSAVAQLCSARVKGNEIGSARLEFHPKEIIGGSLSLDVGTAGSTALVLQPVMIAAMHCKSPLGISITGGTFNRWAPTIGYLQNVTLPALRKIGFRPDIEVRRHGFYPAGGGEIRARISPSALVPIELTECGALRRIFGTCTISADLAKAKVAERMQKCAQDMLSRELKISSDINTEYVDAQCSGGGIDLFIEYEHSVIGSNAIAERGKSSEDVAKEAVSHLLKNHALQAPVDGHLADQLIPYMAMAGGKIKASAITEHAKTNIWVCEKFLARKFTVENNTITAT